MSSTTTNGLNGQGGANFPFTRKVKKFAFAEEAVPNYLFACWLREWYEEAAARDSRLQFAYRKALEAMIKWPEKLKSGREASKLTGIGPSISSKLEERHRGHLQSQNIFPEVPDGTIITFETETAENATYEPPTTQPTSGKKAATKSKTGKKEYVPAYRSAPYGCLIALYLNAQANLQVAGLSKSELIAHGQTYSSASLQDGLFPAINGALKTLEAKALIGKYGSPQRFALTVEGAALAERLWKRGERRASQDSLPPLSPSRLINHTMTDDQAAAGFTTCSASISRPLAVFTWPPNSFEIVLLVDVREIRSRDDRNYLIDRLKQQGIASEVRNLELGDFLWIARHKGPSQSLGEIHLSEELVLDTLIERKREDDLVASLSDGRYKEQKHRIARSLLRETFYLVERGVPNSANQGASDFLPGGEERFLATILQCQINDGLMYRQTANLEETIGFLAALHRQIDGKFTDEEVSGCLLQASDFNFSQFPQQFSDINKPSSKVYMNYTAYSLLNSKSFNETPTDVFLRQLMTIKGVTFDRALAIVARHPTPQALYQFYRQQANELAKQDAFKGTKEPGAQKSFGRALSDRIYQVFGRL